MSEESRIATPSEETESENIARRLRNEIKALERLRPQGEHGPHEMAIQVMSEAVALLSARSAITPTSDHADLAWRLEEAMKVIREFPGIRFESDYNNWLFKRDRVMALGPMPKAAQSATGSITPHPDTLWVVWFEDKDHGHEVFFGPGAEDGARRRYKEALDNWSCHLLVRVPTDSTVKQPAGCPRCERRCVCHGGDMTGHCASCGRTPNHILNRGR